ncbi:hypothetical protein GCM10023095_05940 [Pseudaeromonas paramecii]|uniref:Uncharacterized protein n=1 Tax=Pseudaeromonas paramecii TaxID=2138166 RepID=A0ABP8PYL3_9GAMM
MDTVGAVAWAVGCMMGFLEVPEAKQALIVPDGGGRCKFWGMIRSADLKTGELGLQRH